MSRLYSLSVVVSNGQTYEAYSRAAPWLAHPNIKRDVLDAGDGLGTGIGDSIVERGERRSHAIVNEAITRLTPHATGTCTLEARRTKRMLQSSLLSSCTRFHDNKTRQALGVKFVYTVAGPVLILLIHASISAVPFSPLMARHREWGRSAYATAPPVSVSVVMQEPWQRVQSSLWLERIPKVKVSQPHPDGE